MSFHFLACLYCFTKYIYIIYGLALPAFALYMHETVHRQVLPLTLLVQPYISWDSSILIWVAIGHSFSLICSIPIIRIYHIFVIHYMSDGHSGFISKSFFFLGGPCHHHEARRILVPRPGVEPMPYAMEAWSLNHWTAREVPYLQEL